MMDEDFGVFFLCVWVGGVLLLPSGNQINKTYPPGNDQRYPTKRESRKIMDSTLGSIS